MSMKQCIAVIKNAAKSGKIDDDTAMEMLQEVDDFINKTKNIDNIDQALQTHLKERFDDTMLAAVIEKRNSILNSMAKVRAKSFIDGFENPVEGLMAFMGGSIKSKYKSKLSIDVQGKALTNKYVGKLIDQIDKNGDLQVFNAGKQFDDLIARELWELKPDGNPGVTNNAAARRIAEVIHSVQELAVKNSNKSGSFIRSMPGYIMRQSHDMGKIRKMGEDEWLNFVTDKLDYEKTFKGADPEKFLRGVYKGLASGIHRRFKGEVPGESNHLKGFFGPGNLAKKASQERILHFKDADSFMEYNRALGTGDLREGVVHGLEHLARNTALMRNMGTNPAMMLDSLRKDYSLKAQGEGKFKITDQFGSDKIDNIFKELDGTTRIPVNVNGARVGAGIRAIQNLSKLGGATISSITDIPNQAAELRYQGKHVLSAYGNAFANLFRGRGNAETKQMARAMGVGFDGITGDLMSRFHANDHLPGMAAKAQQKFFKLNLMSWWNDSHRTGMVMMMSSNLADNAKLQWTKMNPRLQNVLKQYGIGDAEWNVYRQFGIKKTAKGPMMISEGLETMSDDAVSQYLQTVGKPVNRRNILDARDELMSMLDSFYMDRADHGIPMPGARERAIMNQGTRSGTIPGEMYRLMMQFKSFPITIVRRAIGREVYGQEGGKADLMGLAQLMVATTIFGYGAMYMKDVLKGRSPREFSDDIGHNAKILSAAMTQGGGLGIYGDFLFGEYSRFGASFTDTLIGPTFGQVDSIAELYSKAVRGQDVGATLLNIAKSNTPFINLFYTKMAVDYLFLYQLQEMVNPGYLSRLEQRIMRDNNQTFFLPPSRAVPYGGGGRVFEGVRQ